MATPPDEAEPGPRDEQPEEQPDREAQPVDAEQPPRLAFPVVGIGASAGGLEAVGEFLDAMRPDSGMAFVLVQHLPPDHHSLMAEILGRRTRMPVQQIEDGMAVEANHVYVIRPGHVLTIRDGRLHLGPLLGGPRAANRPIDDFFKSLAEEQRERAIAVLMSGMGSNGTAGAQAVKAVGGLCVAQDPETAQYPSMPRHLIDAGYADHIARPCDIPEALLGYAEHPYARGGRESDAADALRGEREHLREILAIVRTRTRHDFAGYKKPTVLRRVQRRMGLTRRETVGDYARLLRQTPAEASALADDLLIHVTGFFRDPEAWESLRRRVVVPLIAGREAGGVVRAWITACASGEEAYSLAILLVEEAEKIRKQLDIKVFATDLAERALGYARAGVYAGGIESDVSPERLERFFTRDEEVYRVRPELRDRVVFASQNLLQDPPFSRIDIASCRNLLIYLEPEVQHRVLALLHFGLRDGGALFLGTAETVAGAEELFEPVDKKARIYRRVGSTRHGSIEFPLSHVLRLGDAGGPMIRPVPPLRATVGRKDGSRPPVETFTHRALLEAHTPPAVTIDRDHRIWYYHGDTRAFLQQVSGEPTRDLMLLARDGVRGAIRIALHRAAADDARASSDDGWVEVEPGRRRRVAVTVSPVAAPEGGGPPEWFVVSFTALGELAVPPSADADASTDEETRRLREELQSTVEELQTSNEELKASNEEVMSVNEEMQSANEELETSKEEMQSLNEELTTVNSQLRAKVEEHQATCSDLASFLASTDIAVLFLDTSFRIRRYTPAIRDLVDLIAGDVGRSLSALARKFDDPYLDADCRAVLERLVPAEREVTAAGGRHYLRRVTPYRTTDHRIDGVVVTFVDITDRKAAEDALRASEEQFRRAIEDAPIPVLMQADDGQVLQVSRTWTELTGYGLADVPTADAWLTKAYGPGANAVRAHMHELFAGTRKTLDVEFAIRTRGGAERHWSFSASAPGTLVDGRRFLVGMAVDVTDRQRAEERQAFLLALSDALRPLADPEEVQAAAARGLGEHLGLGRAYYVEVDENTGEYVVARDWHRPGETSHARRYNLADWAMPWLADGRTWVVRDTGTDPALPDNQRDTYRGNGIGALVVVPLIKGGGLVATFVTNQRAPRDWTADEVRLVEETAERTWAAVERAKAEAARQEAVERYLALFNAIDQGFCTIEVAFDANDKPVDYRFLEVSPSFEQQTGIPNATGRWMRELVADHDPHWFETYGRVARTGVPERFENYSTPLGRWWHVYAFRIRDPRLHHVGVVFSDITDRKRAEERQAFLLKLSDTLRPLADPVAIEVEATRVLGEYLGADRVLYAEAEPDEDHIRIHRDFTAAGTASIAGRQRLSSFGPHWVEGYRAGRTLVTSDFQDIGEAQPAAFEAIGVRACVGVPVNKDGRFVGVFIVHSATPREWTPSQVSLIEATAERTWAAIERTRVEAALRASEARLRAVAANLPSGAAFVVGPDLRYTLAEGRALAAVGLAPADFEGKTLAEALPPDLAAAYEPYYRRALAGEPFRTEHESHGRQYVTHGEPLRDDAGRVTAVLAVSYDITDLRLAEERLRLALVAARMGIWTLDDETRTHMRDANLNGLLGLAPAETTQPFADFLDHNHPADRDRVAAAFDDSFRNGVPLNVEFRIVRPDGTVRWIRDQGDVFGDFAAGRRNMAGACVDVTDRREAEVALRASEERLQLIVRSATDYAIITLAPDRTVMTWSPGAEATFGYAEGEIVGQPADVLFTPEDRAAGVPKMEAEEAHRVGRAEDERWHARKDGSRFYASGVLTRLGPAGAGGFVKVLRDLTERKQLEDELRAARDHLEEVVIERTLELRVAQERAVRAARLAAIGEMVTGLAHESRNALQRAQACLSVLGLRLRDRPEDLDLLNRLQAAQDDLARHYEDVRQYAVPVHLARRPCDLRAVWREAWADLAALRAARAVDLVEETGGTDLQIQADPFRLRQVFRNLLENALAAAPDPARVVVRCKGAVLRGRPAVRVAVVDNGPGFNPGIRDRLFEPFQTTKVRGTGLGLAICRRLVEAHGGTIDAGPAGGPGAEVIVTFPKEES